MTRESRKRVLSFYYCLLSILFDAIRYALFWNATANSVYDGRYSYVSGYNEPTAQDSVFRGRRNDTGNSIELSLIPTSITYWNRQQDNRNGITLDFLARSLGHQVRAASFYDGGETEQGVTVTFIFDIPQFSYLVIFSFVIHLSALLFLFPSFFAYAKVRIFPRRMRLTSSDTKRRWNKERPLWPWYQII